ncbi:MAG: hypothetical protein QXP36_00465, partial [Conexivisphaerales archaeon]
MKRVAPHENVRQIVIERIGMLLRSCGRDPDSYMLHEVYVNERERIDVLVGDKVAISIKGKKQEFPEAVREGEEKYL